MAIRTTSLGFSNRLQRLVWSQGNNVPVTAYLWGGGGGGGGNDSGIGGAGSGGGFTEVTFLVSAGDVIEVAVGGPGGGGQSGRGQAAGGAAGASYVSEQIFDTRTAAASPPVFPSTNSAYVSFLNTYGVWGSPVTARDFDRSYVVNFPTTGNYTFTTSADNSAKIYIDDVFLGDVPGFRDTYALVGSVSAGNHTIRIVAVNTGGPGSVALTINGGTSYSGGHGGVAGPSGSSGGGGGGGGATVIFKNGTLLAASAGGGGGGGAGNRGDRNGESAPGSAGQDVAAAGQDGQAKSGDGGGGGAGGGGANGGNGGLVRSGDTGALAGAFGRSSDPAQNPSGRIPGGTNSVYYPGTAGSGGLATIGGSGGAAVMLFDIPGVFVNDGTLFRPVNRTWIKVNGVWQVVNATYAKANGVWAVVAGSFAPAFTGVAGNFGVASRPMPPDSLSNPRFVSDSGGGGDNTTGPGTTGRGDDGNVFGGDNYSEPSSSVGAGQNADGSVGTENQA